MATEKLQVILELTTGQYKREAQSAADATRRFGQSVSNVGRNLTVGLALPLAAVGVRAVQSLARIERIGAQTDAVIKSTGGAANVTRQQIDDMAESMERLTSVEAESITEGQNFLLTFTRIRNEVGDGNDIFDQATEAMVDLSVAMGKDMVSSATLVGKALNDPIAGLTALGRAGVQFTEDQKEMIRGFVETGDFLAAQKVILGELNTQFGGSAAALGETLTGRIDKVKHSFGTLAETLAETLLPVIESVVGWFQDAADALNEMDDSERRQVLALAGLAIAISPILSIVGRLTRGYVALKTAILAANAAAVATPGIVATRLGGATAATAASGAVAGAGAIAGGAAALTAGGLALENALREAGGRSAGYISVLYDVATAAEFLGLKVRGAGEETTAASSEMRTGGKHVRDYAGHLTAVSGSAEGLIVDIRQVVTQLRAQHDAMRAATDPAFAYIAALDRFKEAEVEVTRLMAEGRQGTEEYNDAVTNLLIARSDLKGATLDLAEVEGDSVDVMRDLWVQAGLNAAEFDRWAASVGLLGDALRNLPRNIAITGTGNVITVIGGGKQVGIPRQHGGPIWPDEPFLVGERGRELIFPTTTGHVLSNAATERILTALAGKSGPGGPTITINYPQHMGDEVMHGVQRGLLLAGLTQLAETSPGTG